MWQTVRLCGLVGVFGLLAPAARADSVTWTIKPAEPALGPGTIICSGTVSFTTGYTPTIGVFAIPKNGGVVYPGVVAMTVKGTQAKFDATIMNGANKLPNDTYSVWVSVKLTAGMTFTFICSSVETAGVANGAGNHDPKATVTFTPFNNLAGNVSGQGTYAITGQGWKDDQGLTLYLLPAPNGGAETVKAVAGTNGNFTVNVTAPAGDYNAIVLYSVQSGDGKVKQLVGTPFSLVTVR